MVKEGQKRDSPCADSPDRDSGRHLITVVFVIKRFSLYQFTLWGRDFVSVVRIRESRYYGDFFFKKTHENFVRTLETVCNREESVLERCP